jgi:polyisoprenoid-binding protein YceI
MKKLVWLPMVLFAVVLTAFTDPAETVSYSVDTEASTVKWFAKKVTGAHNGHVKMKSGNLDFENGVLKGGSFVMDMTSIVCDDLSGDSKGKLEGHLKSDDFFGVANFPDATFVITQAIPRGTPGSYKIVGNMTIKESTEEIRFNAQLDEVGEQMVGTTSITLDRSQYDIRFGSGSFFENLGDKTIYDDFDLEIELVVNK